MDTTQQTEIQYLFAVLRRQFQDYMEIMFFLTQDV